MTGEILFVGATIAAVLANLFTTRNLPKDLYYERKRNERFLAALMERDGDYTPARTIREDNPVKKDPPHPLTMPRQVGLSTR